MVSREDLFFPRLKRRNKYKTTRSGNYYAAYSNYRQEIREDCLGRCVYCDIHENENGGDENMHLDHFRPKEHFPQLENNPNNLHWSCAKCNYLKSDKWPANTPNSTINDNEGFIDPFIESLQQYFEVLPNGELKPLRTPAKYKIKLLALNRRGRKLMREKRLIHLDQLIEFKKQVTQIENLLKNAINCSAEVENILKQNKDIMKAYINSIVSSELNFNLI